MINPKFLGGALFGILGSKTARWGRDPIVITGYLIHILSFFLIFLNLPNNAPFGETDDKSYIEPSAYVAMLCSFLLGFGDACYNTQIYSTLGGTFAHDSTSAFAIFKFTQVNKITIILYKEYCYEMLIFLYYSLLQLLVASSIHLMLIWVYNCWY